MSKADVRVSDDDGVEYVVRDEGLLTGGVGQHYTVLTVKAAKVVGGFSVKLKQGRVVQDSLLVSPAPRPENMPLVERIARRFLGW